MRIGEDKMVEWPANSMPLGGNKIGLESIRWDWQFVIVPTEISAVLREVEKAIEAGLYYPALSVCFSLPDICVTLSKSDAGDNKVEAYANWVDRYIGEKLSFMPGRLMYKMRCGFSHNGKFWHKDFEKIGFSRVVFTLPDPRGNVLPNSKIDDVFVTDLCSFCDVVIEGVHRWYADNYRDQVVSTNLSAMVRYRPNGFAPMISGLPVIG